MALSKRKTPRPMGTSRVTTKGQATIPAKVRARLNLKSGDSLIFEDSDGRIVIRKAEPLDLEFLSALEKTLSEWNSENDDRAYRDL